MKLEKELKKWSKTPKLELLLELLIDYCNHNKIDEEVLVELRHKFKLLKYMSKDLESLAELACKIAESVEAIEDQTDHLLS